MSAIYYMFASYYIRSFVFNVLYEDLCIMCIYILYVYIYIYIYIYIYVDMDVILLHVDVEAVC